MHWDAALFPATTRKTGIMHAFVDILVKQDEQQEPMSCPICLEHLEPKEHGEEEEEDPLQLLHCGHQDHFHRDCITQWITQYKPECPICRASTREAFNSESGAAAAPPTEPPGATCTLFIIMAVNVMNICIYTSSGVPRLALINAVSLSLVMVSKRIVQMSTLLLWLCAIIAVQLYAAKCVAYCCTATTGKMRGPLRAQCDSSTVCTKVFLLFYNHVFIVVFSLFHVTTEVLRYVTNTVAAATSLSPLRSRRQYRRLRGHHS